MKKWTILNKEILISAPVFKFLKYKLKHSEKKSVHNFYILETNNWVNVLPITKDNKLVLIKQYRAGIDDITIEIPGGIIDDGETPIQAAKRELEEETGFISDDFEILGFVNPNPSFITNKCFFVLAKNVEPLGKINFDPSEYIETFTASFDEVKKLIEQNKITHALSLNGLFLLDMKKNIF